MNEILDNYLKSIKERYPDLKAEVIKNKISFMGAVSQVVLSKQFFKNNSDITPFLKEVFDIEFLEYVMKSRTLILSRLLRVIDSYEEKKLNEVIKKYKTYINHLSTSTNPEKTKVVQNNTYKKSDDFGDTLSRWRKVIKRNNE
jgi:hypothetical protein